MQVQEPDAYEIINKDSVQPVILTCEHASAYIPQKYHNLGLAPEMLDTHIARDKGCGELTRKLAERSGCTAFLANYSRLFIDYNRRENEADLILAESDKVAVPANVGLSETEREYRLENYHRPYYRAIFAAIERLRQNGRKPIIFSIHGFTPQLKGGAPRPWHAGVLYVKENPFAEALLKHLQQYPNFKVDANVPYDLRQFNTGTAAVCGTDIGLENAVIEIRDSEFDDMTAGVDKWCAVLDRFLHDYIS